MFLIARHQHCTRQLGDAVAVDVARVDRHRTVGAVAGGILAVQCQIAQRVVRVDENIRRQTGAIRHLFLSEHGGLAVLHTAGLHALNRSCP